MPQSPSDKLRLAWIEFEGAAVVSGSEVTRTQRVELGGGDERPVVVRLIIEDGARGLLLECEYRRDLSKLASRAIHIGPRILNVEGRDVAMVEVRCLLPRLNSVFGLMADAIANRLEDGLDPRSALIRSVEEFRELLRPESIRGMSREEMLGLFGELTLLNELAEVGTHVLDYWTGPLDSRHDFRSGSGSIEVKCTTNREFNSIRISSIDQLDADSELPLHLAVYAVEHDSAGESVPDLVDRLLEHGVQYEPLYARLHQVGFSDALRGTLNDQRFRVFERRLYRVADGFPSLTRADFHAGELPRGVHKIAYSIDLSHAQDYVIAPQSVESELRSFVEVEADGA